MFYLSGPATRVSHEFDILPIDHPSHLRRLVRAINRQEQPVYLMVSGERRRVTRARYHSGLDVQTMGSAVWFPANPEDISGVSASRTVCGR